MFENMKLGTKLVSSFVVVAVIGLIIGTISVFNMNSLDSYIGKIYYKDLIGMSYVKEAKNNRLDVGRHWRNALLVTGLEEKRQSVELVKKNIALYKENMHKGNDLFYTEQGKALIQEIYKISEEWESLTLQMSAMIVAQNLMEITPEFSAIRLRQEPLGKEISAKIDELSALKDKAAEETVNAASKLYSRSLILMIIFIAASFIVSVIIGLTFSRYVMRQLGGELTDAIIQVKRVSAGNLNSTISLQPRDNSSLLYALLSMQETINALILAQRLMAKKHHEGFISEKIDTTKFQGAYHDMAEDINELVQSHITVKMQVVNVVSQYARGDFSKDFERLPAEKAKITEAMDSVKTSLLNVNKEIELIASAGARGDFSKRSDANRFEFMFKEMLSNLNTLVESCDGAFGDVLRMSNALAQGDLTQKITNNYVGMFDKVKNGMNGTVENLKALVSEIKDASDTINTASQEIAAGNNDLSHRTEQQAASLEETAASMQELTSTVQTNSENAKYANHLALASSDLARKGVAAVNEVVTTMQDINESSRKVVDIITVIDGIAFQTNILALNAAVEAARAGEQGRGFAVVATEVRSLAQRAAAAAGEIKALISDSVDKVEDGSSLVTKAGKTMEEIVTSIQNVTTTIAQITAASTEQTTGIEQVNQAISEMDDVTQRNAALVEEAAAAAEALEEQARHLSVTMSNFKIESRQESLPVVKSYAPSASIEHVVKPTVPTNPVAIVEVLDIDLDGAMKKHSDWKVKLRAAIVNKETLDVATISKDDCCDFGQWLHHEDTHPQIAHLKSYQDCMNQHAAFHLEAGKVAAIINAKKYEQAQQLLGSESNFSKASSAVSVSIMRLKKDTIIKSKAAPKPVPMAKPVTSKVIKSETFTDDWEEF